MVSVRSKEDLEKAKRCAELLYGGAESVTSEMIAGLVDELPLVRIAKGEAKATLADVMVKLGLADSKSGHGGKRVSGRGGQATDLRRGRVREREECEAAGVCHSGDGSGGWLGAARSCGQENAQVRPF